VPSSVIRDYSYDQARRVLTITFVSGDTYDYFDVPRDVYEDLRAAGSRGRYFAASIRNRFSFRRRPGDEQGPSDPPKEPQPALPRGPVSPRGFLSAALERPQPRRSLDLRGRRRSPARRREDTDARR
jgi:lysyl-tRNA synthetase class 2